MIDATKRMALSPDKRCRLPSGSLLVPATSLFLESWGHVPSTIWRRCRGLEHSPHCMKRPWTNTLTVILCMISDYFGLFSQRWVALGRPCGLHSLHLEVWEAKLLERGGFDRIRSAWYCVELLWWWPTHPYKIPSGKLTYNYGKIHHF